MVAVGEIVIHETPIRRIVTTGIRIRKTRTLKTHVLETLVFEMLGSATLDSEIPVRLILSPVTLV